MSEEQPISMWWVAGAIAFLLIMYGFVFFYAPYHKEAPIEILIIPFIVLGFVLYHFRSEKTWLPLS